MAESYVENFKSTVDFPKPFQRTGKFPLDRTELFSSYEDAVKYAAGDKSNPDSRGLCGTSYIGQKITVYENGVVTEYQIQADRTLKSASAVSILSRVLESGESSIDIELPVGSTVLYVNMYDSVTREQVYADVSFLDDSINVSLDGAYENSLDIEVYYQT